MLCWYQAQKRTLVEVARRTGAAPSAVEVFAVAFSSPIRYEAPTTSMLAAHASQKPSHIRCAPVLGVRSLGLRPPKARIIITLNLAVLAAVDLAAAAAVVGDVNRFSAASGLAR
jgi:hypothetical protein